VEKNMRKLQKWKLAKLKEHPRQAEVFGNISEAELAALAEDMRANGLRDPVEILPDGTIIGGHQRVRAAKLLGWTEIDVIVREDLQTADTIAAKKSFLTDNLLRRHLSPLVRAKCIKELVELEQGGRRSSQEEIKKRVGQQLGLSPRSVNRYLLVLATPLAVQRAFDRGELTLINAGKVALLKKPAPSEIARRIENGEKAATVVAEHLAARDACTGNVNRYLERMLAVIRRETPRLRGRLDELGAGLLSTAVPELQEARALLAEVIAWAERVRRLDARRPPPANAPRAAACRTARPGPGPRDPQTGWVPPSPAGG